MRCSCMAVLTVHSMPGAAGLKGTQSKQALEPAALMRSPCQSGPAIQRAWLP